MRKDALRRFKKCLPKAKNWYLFLTSAVLLTIWSCASPGSPSGGLYDETPPHVVSTSPKAYSHNQQGKKITIFFDEYIKLNNASEKIIVSPPQLQMPEIKALGRRISIELKDSLIPETTYTIDFGDAIEDNNEGNPMGDYAYVFSTGERIDTFEVSGNILEASNLEPIKGILVGLHSDTARTAIHDKPFDRVARTNGSGRFSIKGVAPGKYRIYALNDVDGDFRFGQKSEKMAYSEEFIVPSSQPATRPDTLWADSIHIDTIRTVAYTRYLPDNVVLRAFTEVLTDRHLLKSERPAHTHFKLFFTAAAKEKPTVEIIGHPEIKEPFLVDTNAGNDTITYWICDTSLVKNDTVSIRLSYYETNDSTGESQLSTDTLELATRTPYEKIQKQRAEELEKWEKNKEKALKRKQGFYLKRPGETLKTTLSVRGDMTPVENIHFLFDQPLKATDTTRIHLYLAVDTTWVEQPYLFQQEEGELLRYTLYGEWRPQQKYRLVADSAAFTSLYGLSNTKIEQSFSIPAEETYASLFVNVKDLPDSVAVVQLLNSSDKVIRQERSVNGHADFFFLRPGTYYMRLFVDNNRNGVWDTGEYDQNIQPEEVYYYPEALELRARWDIEQDWYVHKLPLIRQKPEAITKQKPDQKKKIQNRNAELLRNKR